LVPATSRFAGFGDGARDQRQEQAGVLADRERFDHLSREDGLLRSFGHIEERRLAADGNHLRYCSDGKLRVHGGGNPVWTSTPGARADAARRSATHQVHALNPGDPLCRDEGRLARAARTINRRDLSR
jgi:hypothetical protein